MPTYNDPAMAAAFGNLAKMFAPPTAAEMLYAAKAAAERGQTQRAAELFDYSKNPAFNQQTFDQMNIANGNYNPSQSYYAVGVNDATTRRGQDVNAATSVANNTADNAQKDRTAALDAQTKAFATAYGNLPEGNVRPAIPSMFGMPAVPAQSGVVKLNQGEQATLPGGQVLSGGEKPLSETEVKAKVLQTLPAYAQVAATMGSTPTATVNGPDGKKRLVYQNDAITGGMPIAPDNASKVDVTNYVAPDGRRGTARADGEGVLWDTQSGERLPNGVTTYKGQAQGTPDQFGGKTTESNEKNAMFYTRGAAANRVLDQMGDAGYTPNTKDYSLILGAGSAMLPAEVANQMVSPDAQRYYSNGMNFMMSVLRPDTGAAFGKKEFEDYGKVFLPMPGDTPQVLADKKQARQIALAALQGNSRGQAQAIAQILANQGLPVPPEMQAVMARGGIQPGQPRAAPQGEKSGGHGAPPYQEGTRLKGPDGKIYVVKGGAPVPE